jgi:hypothetical protein
MPALGAAFAIFTALTLSSEAGYLRAAESLVSDEPPAPGNGAVKLSCVDVVHAR